MGLFDGYQFNPQSYGGGLLERLGMMPNVPLQMPGNGFQDQPNSSYSHGGVQVPVFGQPEQAAIPPAAQPAQYQQQAPQQGGGNSFLAGLQGFGEGGREGGLIGALTGGIGGFSRGETRENQTVRALTSAGISQDLAATVARDPGLLRAVMPQLMGTGGQTDDIKEYQFAKREDPTLTFEKFMQKKRAVSGEYGLTPIWGTDAQGNPAFIQPGKSGGAVQGTLPPGFKIARDPIKVEGPTGTSILDPQTRQVIQFIPKDVAGAAKQGEIGKAEGEATVNLPTTIATAETTLKTIEQLKSHPGKKNFGAFGWGAMLPDAPGGTTRGFGALVDQVKGQNFLTAFQSLKGAGAITEQEGAKAEKAQARLDRAQNEKDFDQAIKDLEDVVKAGMERARQKAGKGTSSVGVPGADLRKKYGLE